MKIYNVHERPFRVSPEALGQILDSLAGSPDRLWPGDRWPPMAFNTALREGARGGHGSVRYRVIEYVPGKRAVFQFDGTGLTAGLDGRHFFEVVPRKGYVVLRHVVDAECDAQNKLKWAFLVGPLHDALLEDALDGVEGHLHGGPARPARWSLWVRLLRWGLARQRLRAATRAAADSGGKG